AGATGKLPEPILDRGLERAPAELEPHHAVAERQLGERVAASDRRAGCVELAAADAAAVHDRDVGMRGRPHRIGHDIANRGLARAYGRGAAGWPTCRRAYPPRPVGGAVGL